jgi:hypothetical protein
MLGSSQWMYSSGESFYSHEIGQSLRFEDGDNASLNRTFSAGNRRTFTYSTWVKRGNLGSLQVAGIGSGDSWILRFAANDKIACNFAKDTATNYFLDSTRVFRDVSAWYHLVIAVDTTQATASNRIKFYVNGELETVTGGATTIPQNRDTDINVAANHRIAREVGNRYNFDGYLAETIFVDGQQLNATDFGETKSGIWIPKEYTGTYGTNGFHLDFANASSLGNDVSGNNNDFTSSALFGSDQVLDSPSNNYPVVNAISGRGGETFSQGNLLRYSDPGNYDHGRSTMALPKSGKWYIEWMGHSQRSNDPPVHAWGIGQSNADFVSYPGGNTINGGVSYSWGMATGSATVYKYKNGVYGGSYAGGHNYTLQSTILQLAVDMDTGKVWFGINNTWKNLSGTAANPSNGTNPAYTIPAADIEKLNLEFQAGRLTNDSGRWTRNAWNFGQDSSMGGIKSGGGNSDANGEGDFQYAPPTGFLALCAKNYPTLGIDPRKDEDPKDYHNAILWTGNNTNNRALTGLGFQPDLVVAKSRSANSGFNWVDAVRGGTKNLQSTSTAVEATTNTVISFQSDGFTVGDGNGYDINKSGEAVVGYGWLAGNGTSSNTDGTITTTVSANTKAGFSIATYTGNGTSGATIGHGLDKQPHLVIIKNREVSNHWQVWTSSLTQGAAPLHTLALNQTYAPSDANNNIRAVGSSVVTIGNNQQSNTNNKDYLAYFFHNVQGYCDIGFYEAHNDSDNEFVYTGFRPAWVMIKSTSGGTHYDWIIHDSTRSTTNPVSHALEANQTQAEVTGTGRGLPLDFVSNGFKIRNSYAENGSNQQYIYIAFAEQPFPFANAR